MNTAFRVVFSTVATLGIVLLPGLSTAISRSQRRASEAGLWADEIDLPAIHDAEYSSGRDRLGNPFLRSHMLLRLPAMYQSGTS